MKVAKRFRWEGAHRLPWHEGGCASLHGHSYAMVVEVEGEPDDRGMLVDFQDLKAWVRPIVDAWDHATLVHDADSDLLETVRSQDWKYAVLPFDTTAENLCRFVLDTVCRDRRAELTSRGIVGITVRIAETETCYAEDRRIL